MMTSKEIRQKWLDFFKSKNHLVVESKSLIPVNDSSLLWINSGVATLKDYFSGKKIPPAKRLTNSQKAIRTNDIENVGVTSRHHTFFEMLGNFSIGDYFKEQAIDFGFEFLTTVLKLPLEKLYFTYYAEDTDTKKRWMHHGIKESHMIKGTRDTNFWDVGSGPCGPCTEIYYDRGEKYDKRGIELLQKDIENDRYIEIWNIVFSQFNNDGENHYSELKQKNIDTGAGLERIVAIMQDAPTNYDSDLFLDIIHEIEKYTPFKYEPQNYFKKDPKQTEINTNFKIIADHVRTVANAIADGEKVSNVGRGYIIRRLIRRSLYKGMQLKIKGNFLYKLVQVVHDSLPFEYDVKIVAKAIKDEEELFSKTVENGKILLKKNIDSKRKTFSGEVAFNLFETYGFPIELTTEILAQKGIKVDMKGYEEAKVKHANASRGEKVAGMEKVINSLALIKGVISEFIGYEHLENKKAKVVKLMDDEKEVKSINGEGYVVLDKTPFYATCGGQNHDHGYMIQGKNKIEILDVFKDKFGNNIHLVKGKMNIKDPVECYVDKDVRIGMARNHSATHLLFCALRDTLGHLVEQLGSDITEKRLTFDFPADEKLSDEQVAEVEKRMHQYIAKDVKRTYNIMTTEQAKKMGVIMTIEETEYMDPKNVRMVDFKGITQDLCGGTHVEHSGVIEDFKITSVDKKQAGIFRIRAITSKKLVAQYYKETNEALMEELNNIIAKNKSLDKKYDLKIVNDTKNYEASNKHLRSLIEKAREDYKELYKNASVVEFDCESVKLEKIGKYEVYINLNLEASSVKVVAATLREKFINSIIVVGSTNGNQVLLAIASKKVNANELFQKIAKLTNGRGGGNPLTTMGKVDNVKNLVEIIKKEINA